ncbi:MAG: response regulator [Chloroflexota bacterium]|nr:response regulator [Chloroflexota bacterium]
MGTGLGLATCYGIVKQSGGDIRVYSEIGVGTTMNVYLPRLGEAPEARPAVRQPSGLPTGAESLLLVEDEAAVRNLAVSVLRRQGYKVVAATNGREALALAQSNPELTLDLLVTDVVMPQMGGRELVEKIRALRPDLKVLYMSGYAENAIAHHGVLEAGVHFIQKPLSIAAFVRAVRQALDQPPLEAHP